jgi:hypothetical protein
MIKIISNLVSKGIERPVFAYKSSSSSFFCPGLIGLQAHITVVLAFSFPITDALAELIVCCSIDYNNDF